MKRRLGKYYNLAAAGATAVFLILAVMALHDMQTAEGVGLYFALKAGKERLLFDVAVDVLATLVLLVLVCLPTILLKHGNVHSLLRCLLLFLSFMPKLSMAYLLRPLEAEGEALPNQLKTVTGTILPVLCLLAGAVAWSGELTVKHFRHKICLFAAAVLLAVTVFVPSLQQLLYFVLTYLLVLVCCDLWEQLRMKYPAMNRWGNILFGGLAFRAFYVLAEVLRKY